MWSLLRSFIASFAPSTDLSLTYPLPVALFGRGYIDLLGLHRFPLGDADFKHAMI